MLSSRSDKPESFLCANLVPTHIRRVPPAQSRLSTHALVHHPTTHDVQTCTHALVYQPNMHGLQTCTLASMH